MNEGAAQVVANAPEWWYYTGLLGRPDRDVIALKSVADRGEFATARQVFDVIDRAGEGFVPSGGDVDDKLFWKATAERTRKIIHVVLRQGEPSGTVVATYHPDGRIEKK